MDVVTTSPIKDRPVTGARIMVRMAIRPPVMMMTAISHPIEVDPIMTTTTMATMMAM
jgi:hypothetical protein